MNVVVVTHTDLGWDCVCGVFPTLEKAVADLNSYRGEDEDSPLSQEGFEGEGYVFSETTLELE